LPLGRKTKDKPQAVRYVGLATWKTEKNKPQAVRYMGLVAWKKDRNKPQAVRYRTCHLEERQIKLKLSVM